MKKKLRPHYSGNLSVQFWKKVNSAKVSDKDLWLHLYGEGCKLQDLEYKILKLLSEK